MSDNLKNKFIELWEKSMLVRLKNTEQVQQEINDERVLIIRLDEILADRDALLNKLSVFLQKEINNEMIEFYDRFKLAQQVYLKD